MAHMGNLAKMTQSLRNFDGYDETEVRNTPSTTGLPGFENSVGSDCKKLIRSCIYFLKKTFTCVLF